MRRAVGAVTGASSLFVCTPGVRCSRPAPVAVRAAARVERRVTYTESIQPLASKAFVSALFHPHFSLSVRVREIRRRHPLWRTGAQAGAGRRTHGHGKARTFYTDARGRAGRGRARAR